MDVHLWTHKSSDWRAYVKNYSHNYLYINEMARYEAPPRKNKVENRYGWKPRPLFLDNYSKTYN